MMRTEKTTTRTRLQIDKIQSAAMRFLVPVVSSMMTARTDHAAIGSAFLESTKPRRLPTSQSRSLYHTIGARTPINAKCSQQQSAFPPASFNKSGEFFGCIATDYSLTVLYCRAHIIDSSCTVARAEQLYNGKRTCYCCDE